MALLIVESPAKAKTIGKYLSKEFKVAASFGHVRDLPAKNGSVDPDNDFAIKYEIIEKAEKYVKELTKQASKTSPCNRSIPVSGHWDDIFFLDSYISMFVQTQRQCLTLG